MKKLMVYVSMLCLVVSADAQEKAPVFKFNHVDGAEASLSDLKGKVLYVSFWASWCKPCIVNFEKYNETREELEDIGVTLLNVNIDQTEEKWMQSLEQHDINGVHVRGQDLDSLQSIYQLYSIPSYEIINKKGEFVYLSEGENRNLIEEFKSWVKE